MTDAAQTVDSEDAMELVMARHESVSDDVHEHYQAQMDHLARNPHLLFPKLVAGTELEGLIERLRGHRAKMHTWAVPVELLRDLDSAAVELSHARNQLQLEREIAAENRDKLTALAARIEGVEVTNEVLERQCREQCDLRGAAEAQVAKLRAALERIAEGNLGDQPWQANYERVQSIARAALKDSVGEGGGG